MIGKGSSNLLLSAVCVGALVAMVWTVNAGAAIPDAAKSDPRFALGYIVVTHYPGVSANGAGDSTAGIQAAIIDAYNDGLAVLFPPGEYKISDTLKCYEWNFWDARRNHSRNPDDRKHILIGSALGAKRPVIKLAPNSPRFGDPKKPRPLIAYRVFSATNEKGIKAIEPDEPILGAPPNFMDQPNILFDSEWRGIDIDCGGNAGAVGLTFRGAQDSSIEDVKVMATGAYSGISGIPGRNGGAFNIEVEGGRYGLDLSDGGLAGPVVAGARLIGQTERAIRQGDFCPLMLVGFHIVKDKGPVATVESKGGSSSAIGTMALVDGVVELGKGGLVFDNVNAAKTFYLRNVYVKGANELVKSGKQPAIEGAGQWTRIREYAYTDQADPKGKPPYSARDRIFRTYSLIDGALGRVPEPVCSIEKNSSAPPSDLVSRHLWTALPSYEGQDDGTVVVAPPIPIANPAESSDAPPAGRNAATRKKNRKPNPTQAADARPAIQAAIDKASAAGHGRVFLPKGQYQIGGPLILRANTKLFGVGRDITEIRWHDSWQPTSGMAFMLQTENDANADTTLAFLTIHTRTVGGNVNKTGAFEFDRFGAIHWRAGRHSMIAAIKLSREYAGKKMDLTNPRDVVKFSDSGGGKHYSLQQRSPQGSSANPGFRVLRIEGTREPLAFYGLNVECTKRGAVPCETNIEITNAENIRIYGTKREGDSPTIILRDSRNVAYYGLGRKVNNTFRGSGGLLQIYGASDNIVIAPAIIDSIDSVPNGEPMLREQLAGGQKIEIAYPECISVYKRGEIDDSMFSASSAKAQTLRP
jgi:hypothetical protein